MYRPPFSITPKILNLIASIQELCGELKSYSLVKPPMKLRKENRIQTIHHSLAIEGNKISPEQITAILENRRVIGPKNQIKEVENAINLYSEFNSLNPLSEKDLLKAHKILTSGLLTSDSGNYRVKAVGVFKGTKVSHVAPPAKQVPLLMKQMFEFLNKDRETPWIIKACVFHYELEFIHPFSDGNGRMGRLWQQLILMKQNPIFEFMSTESIVHARQKEYYRALEQSDRAGSSTLFIEFLLETILKTLQDFQQDFQPQKPKSSDRIAVALEQFGKKTFSRKDYLNLHKGLSTATASRDLAQAVKQRILKKMGDKSKALYCVHSHTTA